MNGTESEIKIRIDGPLDAKGSRWEARCEMTSTGLEWRLRGNLAKAVAKMMETSVTQFQAAYAALWVLQSDSPAINEARRAILAAIGGKGSDAQREALQWGLSHLPHPMNIDPHITRESWLEAGSEEWK